MTSEAIVLWVRTQGDSWCPHSESWCQDLAHSLRAGDLLPSKGFRGSATASVFLGPVGAVLSPWPFAVGSVAGGKLLSPGCSLSEVSCTPSHLS